MSPQEEAEMAKKLEQIVSHVKAHKVVVLEELGSTFGLKTQDVIARLKQLEKDDKISGVIDDRGKFICSCARSVLLPVH